MPKILIVFYNGDRASGTIADAIAEGAESIRFSEVDVRTVGEPTAHVSASKPRRAVASAEELASYDAIVVGGASPDGSLAAPVAALLDAAASERSARFADKVGSAFTVATVGSGALPAAATVARLATLGMILVPPVGGPAEDAAAVGRARALGRRVAQVTGWVAHALGHERDHSHAHSHSDGHGHGHGHEPGHEHGHGHEHRHEHGHGHEHGGGHQH